MTAEAIVARMNLRDPQHGPLPPLLMILTVVTGLVDAVSYLDLGRIFVANMTGNVVFLGFAIADAQDFSIPASLAAIFAFLLGAAGGGRLAASTAHRGRLLATTVVIEIVLVAVALVAVLTGTGGEVLRYALIVLLAVAMGLQNAAARRLGVPDLTTTVLTLTLTGFAAESSLAGGHNPRISRRVVATIAMFLGAAIGAYLVLNVNTASVLALALLLLIAAGIPAVRYASSSEAWATA
jgi:uncharacterized membrane protein YoaK (UPF0700 family)